LLQDPAVEEKTGCTAGDAAGRTVKELIGPSSRDENEKQANQESSVPPKKIPPNPRFPARYTTGLVNWVNSGLPYAAQLVEQPVTAPVLYR
jgi:hypothetical protein